MPPDLNGAPAQVDNDNRQQPDVEALSDALRLIARRYLPELFPLGRIEGDELRVADVTGRSPRKQGSCVIQLAGPNAGDWIDFDDPDRLKGGPLSTIKERLGLSNDQVIPEVISILERYGGQISQLQAPHHAHNKRDNSTELREAAHVIRQSIPLTDTPSENYIIARGINIRPTSDDLRHNDNCTDYRTNRGEPALIARFRFPDGTPTGGAHRIYLRADGSGYTQKKMIGPCRGGLIMLDDPADFDGTLGVGEGIETTLAATQLYRDAGCPVAGWAAASDGGMRGFGVWLRDNPAQAQALGIRKIMVFADRGEAGESAAHDLVAAARSAGLPVVLCLPKSDDDFAKDLVEGLKPDPVDWDAAESGAVDQSMPPQDAPPLAVIATFDDISAGVARLATDWDTQSAIEQNKCLTEVMVSIANARLAPTAEDLLLAKIKSKTKMSLPLLRKTIVKLRGLNITPKPDNKPPWFYKFTLNFDDEPKPIAANVLVALTNDDGWRGVLGFDEFAQRPMMMRRPPWIEGGADTELYPRPFNDIDESRTLIWMQQLGLHVHIDAVRQALSVAIDDNRYHPVRDYLESLVWDSTPRLDNWLTCYLGVVPIEHYTSPIGACWMISAVARIFEPGCIAKYALIFEGQQDLKKSTALEILGSTPWYTDDIAELGTKDAAMQVGNAWIVELSELDSTRRAHNSAIKSFISRKTDKFRKPFGRHVIEQPRQCVLAGTVNPSGPMFTDSTGAVRFWPVECTKIDADALSRDRDQLWAEAVSRYRAGEKWYLDDDKQLAAAHVQQDLRYDADSWEANIERWLVLNASWLKKTTVGDILQAVFEMPPRDHDKRSQTRVGIAMRRIGPRLGWRIDVSSRVRPRPYVRDGTSGSAPTSVQPPKE